MHEYQEIMRLRAIVDEYADKLLALAKLVEEYDGLSENTSLMDRVDLLDEIIIELREVI